MSPSSLKEKNVLTRNKEFFISRTMILGKFWGRHPLVHLKPYPLKHGLPHLWTL